MKGVFASALLLTWVSVVVAQSTYRLGILPDLVVSKTLDDRHKIYAATESRFGTTSHLWDDRPAPLAYDLTDVSVTVSRKTSLRGKVAASYLQRWRDGAVTHRFIQMLSTASQISKGRLSHRWVTDQTVNPDSEWVFRGRYRIAMDRALQGEKVDPGEWYVKVEHEYLGILADGALGLEMRLVPAIGWVVGPQSKIEVAIDGRLSDPFASRTATTVWTKLNMYYSFR